MLIGNEFNKLIILFSEFSTKYVKIMNLLFENISLVFWADSKITILRWQYRHFQILKLVIFHAYHALDLCLYCFRKAMSNLYLLNE